MSDKERLEEAKKMIGQMRLILSIKTDKDKIAYIQSKIDLFEWMIEQVEQNSRYREAIEYVINAKVNQYASVENIINDMKFVLSEALESESDGS